MRRQTRRIAGMLLILLPTVVYGGTALLTLLIDDPRYMANKLRQDLWRAGHAHAGVLLTLSLICLRYVDDAYLPRYLKQVARIFIPLSAIFLPAGFIFSVLTPEATEANRLIYLAYAGAVILAIGILVLGLGLVRKPRRPRIRIDVDGT